MTTMMTNAGVRMQVSTESIKKEIILDLFFNSEYSRPITNPNDGQREFCEGTGFNL